MRPANKKKRNGREKGRNGGIIARPLIHGKWETWYILKRQEKLGTGCMGKCDSAYVGEETMGTCLK